MLFNLVVQKLFMTVSVSLATISINIFIVILLKKLRFELSLKVKSSRVSCIKVFGSAFSWNSYQMQQRHKPQCFEFPVIRLW